MRSTEPHLDHGHGHGEQWETVETAEKHAGRERGVCLGSGVVVGFHMWWWWFFFIRTRFCCRANRLPTSASSRLEIWLDACRVRARALSPSDSQRSKVPIFPLCESPNRLPSYHSIYSIPKSICASGPPCKDLFIYRKRLSGERQLLMQMAYWVSSSWLASLGAQRLRALNHAISWTIEPPFENTAGDTILCAHLHD